MTSGNQVRESFTHEVRNALIHLYDLKALHQSPLVKLIHLEQKPDPAFSLQNTIIKTIEAIKPKPDIPKDANIWRLYYILYYRFIEQSSQNEASDDLALSIRQLRRQEKVAIELLADHFWSNHQVESHPQLDAILQSPRSKPDLSKKTPSMHKELIWLDKQSLMESINLIEIVQDIITILAPVFLQQNVKIQVVSTDGLSNVQVKPVALRQTLISLFTTAANSCQGNEIQVGIDSFKRGFLQITITGTRCSTHQENEHAQRDLDMARRLIQVCMGTMWMGSPTEMQQSFYCRIVLPNDERILILVLDDNEDTLGLINRYLHNTRYQFIGTTRSEHFLHLCEVENPNLVILDIMLPGIDGWEVLGRLREHPGMKDLPIVVSTILPEEQLALTLGATGFIHKPFSQKFLLSMLDRQIGLESIKPH